MFDENQVRAEAGITMALGAVAFVYASSRSLRAIKVVTTFFFIDFLMRATVGLRYSPVGVFSPVLVRRLRTQ